MPVVALNAFVSFALKVKDNHLHIMMVPVPVAQNTSAINPVAKPLHNLLGVLMHLSSIRYMCHPASLKLQSCGLS